LQDPLSCKGKAPSHHHLHITILLYWSDRYLLLANNAHMAYFVYVPNASFFYYIQWIGVLYRETHRLSPQQEQHDIGES